MREDVKQKWVAALRSGEYAQGRGTLRNNADKFCCLGVLCDLAEKEGVVTSRPTDGGYAWSYGGDALALPEVVSQWAGIDGSDPRVKGAGSLRMGYPSLSILNDGWGDRDIQPHTFEEIADIIEEHL